MYQIYRIYLDSMRPDWHQIRTLAFQDFDGMASLVCRYQLEENLVYRRYADAIGFTDNFSENISPPLFLPISFFKSDLIVSGEFSPQTIFESSGTTGSITSRHAVRDLDIYRDQLMRNFERVYGPVQDWCILALLPSYLERGNSSLVFMVNELIGRGGHPESGFYLNEWDQLIEQVNKGEREGRKTMLIGVGFALLDLAEKFTTSLKHTLILETGGMKGRRKEWVREELHDHLKHCFGVDTIHAEYGMTELLSQAYSVGNGIYECPPWMRVLIREEEDPLTVKKTGKGLLNIIDLANIHSCAFVATDDIGEVYADGRFSVLGRRDGSDLRGCSLMVS
ncbi:MAG: hypothetical protein RL447_625 [Bacteroidota bacterium]